MNGHFSLGDIHPIKYFYTVAVCLGLIFYTISQAEGAHPFWSFIQWQLQSLIPITLLIVSHVFWANFDFFQRLGNWYRLVISGATGTILTTPFALLTEILLANEPWPTNWLFALLEEWGGLSVPVIISWLLMNAPLLMGYEYRKQPHKIDTTDEVSNEQVHEIETQLTELQKLSNIDDLNNILAMSSELHYLDVIELDDHHLILYSLAAAMESMPEEQGMQVHRSHWVAYSAISEFNKVGRQGVITLKNEKQIPVSRNYFKEVKTKIEKLTTPTFVSNG